MKLEDLHSRLVRTIDDADPRAALDELRGSLVASPALERRVSAHRHTCNGVRVQALESTFPVVRAILGERPFERVAMNWVERAPSLVSDLNLDGEAFPEALAALEREAGFEGMPYLRDLARLEWFWQEIVFEADDPPFDRETFDRAAGLHGPELRLRPAAALRTLRSPWPLLEIWRQHRAGTPPASVDADGDSHLVFWRDGVVPQLAECDAELYRLVVAAAAGESLGELAGAELAVERAGELLERGWFVDALAPPDRDRRG